MMATFHRFQDIEAWQKARILTREVYEASKYGPFAKDFGLRDQMCRSAVSIMANIAEGFGREGRREFLQFLSTTKGSASETQSHLCVAIDQNYISEEKGQRLITLADEIARMITGLMKYLRRTDIDGAKYKND